jgi:hypothetical protein
MTKKMQVCMHTHIQSERERERERDKISEDIGE